MREGLARCFWFIKYTEQLESGFIWTSLFGKIVDVIRILLPLYLSKHILESVISGIRFEELFRSVATLSTAYFLLSILAGYLKRKATYHYRRLLKKHQMTKAMAILEMDYAYTERDDVQNELVSLKQLEKTVAMGILSFQENYSILLANSLCMLLGFYFVRDLFFAFVPDVSILLSLGVSMGYLLIIFFLHYFAVKIDLKTMKKFGSASKNIYIKNHRYLQQYSELLFDYKSGKDIRLYSEGLGRRYNEVYRKRSSEVYNVFFRLFSISGASRNFIAAVISVLTALFVGYRAVLGSIDLSDVFLCIGVLELLFTIIQEMTEAFAKLISSDDVRKKLKNLLQDRIPEFDTDETAKVNQYEAAPEIEGPSPTIEFQNVSFSYPNSELKVLKDVNLKLYGNQKMALVGLNGSGKTTLIKLLLGLYAPSEGRILINGEDSAYWKQEDFIRFFSVVFQDFKLFSLKIGENVGLSEDYDEKLVRISLEKTGLAEFYKNYGGERHLYRDFEEGGIEISGGEEQKIAMARAIYHGGEFFVLDEPTAALDPLSEYEIYTHFGEIISEHPAIYISHRLSSCIFCDVVAVMDEGQIVQMGTHEDLLEEVNGVYFKLWNAQAKHYRNELIA